MKKILLLFFFIGFTLVSSGQVLGRFYYNRYWHLTKQDSAYYFRVTVFDTTRLVFAGEVRDFTKSGKPVMKGLYARGKKNGEFTFYYRSGQVESVGNFLDNQRMGVWKYFYSNGNPKQEVEFGESGNYKINYFNDSTGRALMTNGTGPWREEYEEDNIPQLVIGEGFFKDYRKDGDWTLRIQNGRMIIEEKYKNGKFIKGTVYNSQGKKEGNYQVPAQANLLPHYKFQLTEEFIFLPGLTTRDYPFLKKILPGPPRPVEINGELFEVVEESAYPQGGMQAFYKAIFDEIRYPPEARRMGIEGKVFVEFVINKDGTLTEFRVVKGIGAGCDLEAIRAIQASSKKVKWSPGMQKGKPVRQRYTLPIQFRLG